MFSDLPKLVRLPAPDVSLLAQATVVVVACRLVAKALPYRRIIRFAERPMRHTASGVSKERAAWAVRAVNRRLPGTGTCMPEALAGAMLLRHHGHDATLEIGIARERGGVLAHAWVECEGRVVIGASATEFAPLKPINLAGVVL